MGNGALKTDIIEVEEGTDSFTIVRCPDNRPANNILKRFFAELIDVGIICLVFYPIQILVISIAGKLATTFDFYQYISSDGLNLTIFIATFMSVKCFYYYVLYRQKCSTLGKKFFHFRVYRTNTQEPIGIIRIFLREIIGKLFSFLIFPITLGWYLYDKKARLPHDFLGGTMVVEELEEHNGIDY